MSENSIEKALDEPMTYADCLRGYSANHDLIDDDYLCEIADEVEWLVEANTELAAENERLRQQVKSLMAVGREMLDELRRWKKEATGWRVPEEAERLFDKEAND